MWGLTTQVGGARLIIERCTKFISSGDSESPVTDFEVDQDAGTFENCHCNNPDHGGGAFTSSWPLGVRKSAETSNTMQVHLRLNFEHEGNFLLQMLALYTSQSCAHADPTSSTLSITVPSYFSIAATTFSKTAATFGFGRIVISETELPNIFASLVRSGRMVVHMDEWQYDRSPTSCRIH